MANTQISDRHHEYASIDTAPGADGYWCNPVKVPKSQGAPGLMFSRRGGGAGTATIQFKTPETGAAWQDYLTAEDLSDGARLRLDEFGTGVQWRAGVKQGDLSSGTIIIGFDW